ncbi:hypothetical protein AC579_6500 [Pseudocercospora musae]|uniref:Uncharacterized protein n=1 Tax=Pseudocercospora musae TaxID=113226 RepID=A0A139I0U8_9PEZI|nr:hypothetical protein AC579_6500 [Pseudocercospora musae]
MTLRATKIGQGPSKKIGLVNEIMIATNVLIQSSSCVASFVPAWAKESSRINRTEWTIIASCEE